MTPAQASHARSASKPFSDVEKVRVSFRRSFP